MPRWLEIGVRTNGSLGEFTVLRPRQQLTSAPYAVFAKYASEATVAWRAQATDSNAVNNAGLQPGSVTTDKIADGTSTATDLSPALASNTFWRLGGNAGTTPGTHFLGTADGQPLEFKVNGTRALRLENSGDSASDMGSTPDGAPNVIGGSP